MPSWAEPAYRREFAQDDTPAGAGDFDSWVCRTVLNPGRPLFREARYILAEEPDIRDTALYHAVLAAIAEGNSTRGGIAGYLERKSTDLAHPLGVLHDAGLIMHETEATPDRKPTAAPTSAASPAEQSPTRKRGRRSKLMSPPSAAVMTRTVMSCSPSARRSGRRQCPPVT